MQSVNMTNNLQPETKRPDSLRKDSDQHVDPPSLISLDIYMKLARAKTCSMKYIQVLNEVGKIGSAQHRF